MGDSSRDRIYSSELPQLRAVFHLCSLVYILGNKQKKLINIELVGIISVLLVFWPLGPTNNWH